MGTGPYCEAHEASCADPALRTAPDGAYVGHDEPAVAFYANRPGAGNSARYTLQLPLDPPIAPRQDGSGGTATFQLAATAWFGMVLCDSQSWPEYTATCLPDSDANIFEGTDPTQPDYVGHHPGAAMLELQFYPPGWARLPFGFSCDARRWCAAMTIDSFQINANTLVPNNTACLNLVGDEPLNFAFVTRDGVAQAPANPISLQTNLAVSTPDPDHVLFFNPGDQLTLDLHDSPDGVHAALQNLTTHQEGSMTASVANGFGQVVFDPTATTCTVTPYAFHPMYSTSSDQTRTTWTAHAFNIGFVDEIGHFELCRAVTAQGGTCAPGGGDGGNRDPDDTLCFAPPFPPFLHVLVPVGGCYSLAGDLDVDGASYQPRWPGTSEDRTVDQTLHPTSLHFTSPLFDDGTQDYDRVAVETNLPVSESEGPPPVCVLTTGQGCANPPHGAQFYPFFTLGATPVGCVWQFGGASIPGTTRTFGGSATTEYGALVPVVFPDGTAGPASEYLDFRNILPSNPCPALAG
jgi:hypothetical protein